MFEQNCVSRHFGAFWRHLKQACAEAQERRSGTVGSRSFFNYINKSKKTNRRIMLLGVNAPSHPEGGTIGGEQLELFDDSIGICQ